MAAPNTMTAPPPQGGALVAAVPERKPTSKMTAADLNGPQKVAVLCMALGAEAAVKLTQALSPEEAEQISLHIAQMDHVAAGTVEAVMNEWMQMAVAVDSIAEGGMSYASEVLEKAFGHSKASATLNRIQSQLADSAGLHRLRSADPQQLATTLRGEHPQTIALVLAHLEAQQTATVLRDLDPSLGGDVMYRIGCMEKVAPDMMLLVEKALSNETDLSFTRGLRAAGGPDAVANVLNHVPGTLEKDLLDRINERDMQLAEEIKNLMFGFEDVGKLDDRSLQRALREFDARTLALALKNAKEPLKERIMSGMSQRAVTALKDEIQMLGAVRLRDVEAAQAQIVSQVRALEAAGEITVGATGTEDAFIE